MAEIKIDKQIWNDFTQDAQNKAIRFLKHKGILGEHDTIVEVEGLGAAPLDQQDCIDECIPAANAAFVACMQVPDADEKVCFEVRAEAFYACMADCQDSKTG